MNPNCQRLKDRFYAGSKHPYQIYEDTVKRVLRKDCIVVDIGCGYEAPDLHKISRLGLAKMLIGLDLVTFTGNGSAVVTLIRNDVSRISLKNDLANMVISKSVLEHLGDPQRVFKEVHRILEKKGKFIILTPNKYDYSSIIAKIIPNAFHAYIVSKVAGRNVGDVFHTFFLANTYSSIKRFAVNSGFKIITFEYIGQYPAYLTLSPVLFLLGTFYDKLICKYNCLRQFRGWILAVLEKE
ncbi:MAG TPA: methyltransferase domain-containing protein [Syntrophobacteraceae bacterium]|nr:methyltransferase domain-containing protein [Syntrophobacteraceae bacterium]